MIAVPASFVWLFFAVLFIILSTNIIQTISLHKIFSRLQKPVTMNRFRPNLVVSGCDPFAEDKWKKIKIGAQVFYVVKPCSRCIITTVDPATGRTGKEPLKTLATFRKVNGKVMFGQNLVHETPGRVSVGEQVDILEKWT
ncbi:hypothetical protein A2V82_02160 [candidate division KSB1 bacterium RBG_16_48_16]|nr:MAG: hypothetical protein A2V82_02160 [candidate division KSB1 bacterium RBG_16_48_16]